MAQNAPPKTTRMSNAYRAERLDHRLMLGGKGMVGHMGQAGSKLIITMSLHMLHANQAVVSRPLVGRNQGLHLAQLIQKVDVSQDSFPEDIKIHGLIGPMGTRLRVHNTV